MRYARVRNTVFAALGWLALLALTGAARAAPVIHYFVATPGSVTAGQSTTLRWAVQGADSVAISGGIGAVASTGTRSVTVSASTTYVLTATSGAQSATHELAVRASQFPSTQGGRFVRMVSPNSGQHFLPPGRLRVIAAAYDPTDASDNERNADRVVFHVDDEPKAEVLGQDSEYWVFKTAFTGVAAGRHRVWARAHFKNGVTLDSEPVWIDVDPPPAYAQSVSLSGDVVLSGNQSYELKGTPAARIRLDGQGHRIVSADGWTGSLTLEHVDVVNLGAAGVAQPAMDLGARAQVRIANSIFETSGILHMQLSDAASVQIVDNEFRSNATMPLAQLPEFEPQASYPAIRIRGSSSGQHVFRGNRVGAGWLDLQATRNWQVGGDSPADANVLIGPRVGIWMRQTQDSQLRRNLVYHVYFGGWSQGNVVEVFDSDDLLIEHNVIGGGSWPVRGVSGEFRYNLVLDAGHEWIWITGSGASVHHNVFVGGDGDVAPLRLIYPQQNVAIHNNTLDGLGAASMRCPIGAGEGTEALVEANAIVGMPNAPQFCIDGTVTADYNLFHGRSGQGANYSDGRTPAHDVGGGNAQVDPEFTGASDAWRHDWESLWQRRITPAQVLAFYRARYTPAVGSPLIGAGPASAQSVDVIFASSFEAGESGLPASSTIGAIGVGSEPFDEFGKDP